MKKHIFALASTLTVLSSVIQVVPTQASTVTFKDLPESHWAYQTIKWAVDNKIVDGYEDGTFKPDKEVSQSEFMKMAFEAYDLAPTTQSSPWDQKYYDYAKSQNWFTTNKEVPYIRGLVAMLITNMTGKNFDTKSSVRYLLDEGYVNGKVSNTVEGYGIDDKVTRAEAVTFIMNLKGKLSTPVKVDTTVSRYDGKPSGIVLPTELKKDTSNIYYKTVQEDGGVLWLNRQGIPMLDSSVPGAIHAQLTDDTGRSVNVSGPEYEIVYLHINPKLVKTYIDLHSQERLESLYKSIYVDKTRPNVEFNFTQDEYEGMLKAGGQNVRNPIYCRITYNDGTTEVKGLYSAAGNKTAIDEAKERSNVLIDKLRQEPGVKEVTGPFSMN
ncbi:hypothetical protein J2T17_004438 [Paenibacillus mucilaginosus]|uniref:S-layer homology domain-containing protein n=1 Tax=Paenibacillus mucilaginosus TaxID=61624 RepID=UPI003D1E9CBA